MKRLRGELQVTQKTVEKWEEAFRDLIHPLTRELNAMGRRQRAGGRQQSQGNAHWTG